MSEILKWYFLVGFCSVIICYIPVLVFVVFVATMAPVGPTGRKGSQFNLASLFEAAALSHGGTFEGCLLGN